MTQDEQDKLYDQALEGPVEYRGYTIEPTFDYNMDCTRYVDGFEVVELDRRWFDCLRDAIAAIDLREAVR